MNLGRRALFVRFIGCNLTCGYPQPPRTAGAPAEGAMRCDTEYTWNAAKHDLGAGRHLSAAEIWSELLQLDPATTNPALPPVDLIVVSGGEPLMRTDTVLYLARQARSTGRRLEVETNATIAPVGDLIDAGVSFNAGLKLASSAVPRAKRIKPAAIAALRSTGRTRWKFVITGPDDLDEVAALQDEFALTGIWLSPEGVTRQAVIDRMRMVADEALARGWNLTTRQHVLIWGDERGK
ncbi:MULTISPECIES: 7-carboxy-7-deazaguanine synthase QueE [Micromonosporaceae]|uniref:7-carboxy-7-deazaguanine synthase QueE n=1 Tax=Micromonosporaceae TaxID=28056 RepID=UPI002DD9F39F|nr:7-carboxy-7-deazaguanine synthase QueE [Micromonospora sp. NBC_01813]WSA07046.1 7-carboxy-7-deazaguanine synthase QueE [Micromonospora sp. NBC_01813]